MRLLSILILVTCLTLNAHSEEDAAREVVDTSSTTQIVLLGTGTPNADPERQGPSLAIVVNGMPYLVDFGPGVVRRAAAAHLAGIEGLAVKKLTRAFVTHLHSDHIGLVSDMARSC